MAPGCLSQIYNDITKPIDNINSLLNQTSMNVYVGQIQHEQTFQTPSDFGGVVLVRIQPKWMDLYVYKAVYLIVAMPC